MADHIAAQVNWRCRHTSHAATWLGTVRDSSTPHRRQHRVHSPLGSTFPALGGISAACGSIAVLGHLSSAHHLTSRALHVRLYHHLRHRERLGLACSILGACCWLLRLLDSAGLLLTEVTVNTIYSINGQNSNRWIQNRVFLPPTTLLYHTHTHTHVGYILRPRLGYRK
jgi:hypothetical protein